jgi:hypothetical protein
MLGRGCDTLSSGKPGEARHGKAVYYSTWLGGLLDPV